MNKLMNITVTIILAVAMLSIAPRYALHAVPGYAWGYVEGYLDRDLTGFAFTELDGIGRCRIDNAKLAMVTPDSRVVFGWIHIDGHKPLPHLWAYDTKNQKILDISADPSVGYRTIYATVDPESGESLWVSSNITDETEKFNVKWAAEHFQGVKDAIEDKAV